MRSESWAGLLPAEANHVLASPRRERRLDARASKPASQWNVRNVATSEFRELFLARLPVFITSAGRADTLSATLREFEFDCCHIFSFNISPLTKIKMCKYNM